MYNAPPFSPVLAMNVVLVMLLSEPLSTINVDALFPVNVESSTLTPTSEYITLPHFSKLVNVEFTMLLVV